MEHARLEVCVSVGRLLDSYAYAHCDTAIPRLVAGGTDRVSPQLTQRVLQKTRLRRSELADLILVLQTHFNNHYITLTPFCFMPLES